jgi:hypothetical protein
MLGWSVVCIDVILQLVGPAVHLITSPLRLVATHVAQPRVVRAYACTSAVTCGPATQQHATHQASHEILRAHLAHEHACTLPNLPNALHKYSTGGRLGKRSPLRTC